MEAILHPLNKPSPPWPPTAPTGFTASVLDDLRINLQWVDTSDNETAFHIEICTGGLSSTCEFWDNIDPNVQNALADNLTPDTLYGFKIYAYNSGGASETLTAEASTTPPRPNPIEGISKTQDWISPSETTVGMTVEWVHTSSNTSGYILERRTDESSEWEVQEYGSAIREAAQENLTPRTIYHYRLKAWNEWGETGM